MKRTAQPQPSQSEYGFEFTDLLPRLTRASYRAATGQQAAPWDKARRISRIYDEDALALPPDDPYVIQYWDNQQGRVTRRTEVITNFEASHPNLPGVYDYPKYSPAKSGLYVPTEKDPSGKVLAKSYVDVYSLSDYKSAETLRDELRAAEFDVAEAIEEEQLAAPYGYMADDGETRRIFNLTIDGKPQNVGWMLKVRYANGVNSPGQWQKFETGVSWVSSVSPDTGTTDPRPEVHIPQRDLLANERIVVVQIGVVVIQRTDIANPIADAAAMPGRVRDIYEIVKSYGPKPSKSTF